jgi:hypothetical protein
MVTRTRRRGRKDGEEKKRKGARTQGRKDGEEKTEKKKTQRRKGARTQRKPGSQNLKEHFQGAFLPAIRSSILCHPPSYFLPCAFASLRLCVFFLVFPAPSRFLLLSVFVRWKRKKISRVAASANRLMDVF